MSPLTNDQLIYFGSLIVIFLGVIKLADDAAAVEPPRKRILGSGPKPR